MNIVEKLKKLFFGKKSAEGNSAERERADARSAAEDAEGLIPLLCPSFPFVVQWREESDLSPADSKFGGAPLLPPGFVWPVYAGEVVCPVYRAGRTPTTKRTSLSKAGIGRCFCRSAR